MEKIQKHEWMCMCWVNTVDRKLIESKVEWAKSQEMKIDNLISIAVMIILCHADHFALNFLFIPFFTERDTLIKIVLIKVDKGESSNVNNVIIMMAICHWLLFIRLDSFPIIVIDNAAQQIFYRNVTRSVANAHKIG